MEYVLNVNKTQNVIALLAHHSALREIALNVF